MDKKQRAFSRISPSVPCQDMGERLEERVTSLGRSFLWGEALLVTQVSEA